MKAGKSVATLAMIVVFVLGSFLVPLADRAAPARATPGGGSVGTCAGWGGMWAVSIRTPGVDKSSGMTLDTLLIPIIIRRAACGRGKRTGLHGLAGWGRIAPFGGGKSR